MIKYQLRCRCEHEFEGWFPDSKEYTRQKNKGMINCPMCDSTAVDKALHTISVKLPKKKQKPIPEDYFVMGESAEQILQKLNKKIKKDFQDVGKNFAKEARKAHKGKRDQKFYGKPTKEETNKLLDEGIDLFAVPDYKDN
jgi:hypothetical protein|tara:strand:+ start:68 stop:487 length:420 start_codon:yes stop_codon:yes gene_type:complete